MIARPLAAGPAGWALDRDRAALLVAVGLAACVAASHLEAAVAAFAVAPLLGFALAGVGLAAAGWAVRVARRPAPGVLLGGGAAALALVALWVWTRAVGLPGSGARAPVGVLDALTAFDELLLAGFAVAAARGTGARRAARERWPLVGCLAISLSFIALAMGCEPPVASGGVAQPAATLICHLY